MYELIPASRSDLPFLFELNKAALGAYVAELWGWDDAFQRQYVEERVDLANSRIILIAGERAGRLTVVEHEDHIFLDYVALFPTWQNRGYGTRIVKDVLEEARAKGKAVRLSVLQINPAARLYERLGFTVTTRDAYRIKMLWHPAG